MKHYLILLFLCGLNFCQPAIAGTACTDKTLTTETVQKAFRLAIKTRDALDTSEAQVAIVGRVGQDLSKYGLRFSHAGIIWRDNPNGRWIFSHELNQCGTANSALFNEGLANFFFDDMFAWETIIIIPSPSLQASIINILQDKQQQLALHEAHYNMVAYPFSTRYQNSNQWVLELIADAKMNINPTAPKKPNRTEIQAWLKQANYHPTTLHIPALQRLGGRMFRANVAFDDHPDSDHIAGNINVVSVDSLTDFMRTIDPGTKTQILSLAPSP